MAEAGRGPEAPTAAASELRGPAVGPAEAGRPDASPALPTDLDRALDPAPDRGVRSPAAEDADAASAVLPSGGGGQVAVAAPPSGGRPWSCRTSAGRLRDEPRVTEANARDRRPRRWPAGWAGSLSMMLREAGRSEGPGGGWCPPLLVPLAGGWEGAVAGVEGAAWAGKAFRNAV